MTSEPAIYGLLAEFEDASKLVEAAERAREAGYTKMDGYSPFPIEELTEALGIRHTRLPWLVFLGGLLGGGGIFALQYYSAVHAYPFMVGGKPLFSWPAFLPVIYEATILAAAFFAVLGMLALNGLPMPYHPVFHVERFAHASRDRFFLCIEALDPRFDQAKTKEFLESLQPYEINDVPH